MHRVLKAAPIAFVLALCLIGDGRGLKFTGASGTAYGDLLKSIHEPDTEWVVYLCSVVYLFVSIFDRCRQLAMQLWLPNHADFWLLLACLIGGTRYALDYRAALATNEAMVFLFGALLACGTAWWMGLIRSTISETGIIVQILRAYLVMMLLAALPWMGGVFDSYNYRGHARWSGIWGNPNTCGLLMGVGGIIAAGLLANDFVLKVQERNSTDGLSKQNRLWLKVILLSVTLCVLLIELLRTYSRGAWVASLCGLSYLFWQTRKSAGFQKLRTWRWIQRNGLSLALVICSLLVLAFWQFRDTQHLTARRAFSVGNANDLSWRNRVTGWEGALQMMAERPWTGWGWSQCEKVYDNYFRPNTVEFGAAIQTNDYFVLGASLGVPALICFVIYVWLCLTKAAGSTLSNEEAGELNWLKTICRAGTIVMLVGFWFDDGLFKITEAGAFWIMLGLGRETPASPAVRSIKQIQSCHALSESL